MLVPTGRSYDIRAPFSSLFVALFPLAPMSDKLCLDSIRDPHESQTSLVTPSLPESYPCHSILHHHTPRMNLVQVLYTSRSLRKLIPLEYSRVKATGYPCACGFL
jgi:hypothetical protein